MTLPLSRPCACVAGVHAEGAGGEVQAAGSPGGSHAEGAEVSPTTEGGTPRREEKCLERDRGSALLQNEFEHAGVLRLHSFLTSSCPVTDRV